MGDDLVADSHDENPERPFVQFQNEDFQVCATYPQVTLAPSSVPLDSLVECSKFRTKNRMPTLSYYHKDTGCTIWRSSQPKSGLMGKVNQHDVKMLKEISLVKGEYQKLQVLDARPSLNANVNAIFNGGGFESASTYRNCEFRFENIANIHAVTSAHAAMANLASDPSAFESQNVYLARLDATGYYDLISTILKASNDVVDSILKKNNNVLIHCSDGWDRTA